MNHFTLKLTIHRNGLICIVTHIEVKKNKIVILTSICYLIHKGLVAVIFSI